MGLLNEIEIQIRADGCIAFSALPAELLELVAALCPADPGIRRRVAIMRRSRTGEARGRGRGAGVSGAQDGHEPEI